MGRINDALGRIGLPGSIHDLCARPWDVVVVGGGHNGLTAAAYLAREGLEVLVLERSERLGGACTLEQPFPDPAFAVSPCAYLVGTSPSPGGRGARSAPTRVQRQDRRPSPLVPLRGWLFARPLERLGPKCPMP